MSFAAILKKRLKETPLRKPLASIRSAASSRWDQVAWRLRARRPPTPHREKQRIIRSYAGEAGALSFVETGTFMGDMVAAMARKYRQLHSIELNLEFAAAAKKRFADHSNVFIHAGDSAEILPRILPGVGHPCVYWLDAHFSGGNTARGSVDTPVMAELDAILRYWHLGDVILIDDAADFGTDPSYPSLETLEQWIEAAALHLKMEVKENIIRIHDAEFFSR